MKLRCLRAEVILAFLGAATLCAGETSPAPKLQPSDFEASLVPDIAEICVGEPLYLSFVLTNRTGKTLPVNEGGDYQNALGRPDSFRVHAIDAAGHAVPQPAAGEDMGGICFTNQVPPHGSHTFRLLLEDWATITEPGTYTIRAERPVNYDFTTPHHLPGRAADADPGPVFKAEAKLIVLPRDDERLGKVIAALCEKTARLRDETQAREPMKMLLRMQDERTVPCFLQWLERKDYSMIYQGLEGLARYRTDAALAGLKWGLSLPAEALGQTAKPGVVDPLVENLRYAAACDLTKSPHPDALPFLIAQRKNVSVWSRMTLLLAASQRLPRLEAIRLFQELTQDPDPRVTKEANQFLMELGPADGEGSP